MKEKLSEAVAVYVCGGNSFVLLDHMQKSGFIDHINKRVDDGLIYIGSSAGSVVATNNIIYAGALDDPSKAHLESYDGLSLYNDAIIPHMDHDEFGETCSKLWRRMLEKGYQCQPLNDDQIIYVRGNETVII